MRINSCYSVHIIFSKERRLRPPDLKGEKMKKALSILLALIFALSIATVCASALTVGSGTQVIAEELGMIKTGLLGKPLKFSDTDFKTALGTQSFRKITVTKLPDAEDGVLMLGDRKLEAGQSVRRRSLASLCFIPASDAVTESSFCFTADELCGGAELRCTLKFIEKVNYSPEINTDTGVSTAVTTQQGISVWGVMKAEDPEDDDIDYIIVSYPKYGTLTLSKEVKGEFIYTPTGDYEGRDSFIFVARDEYGNYSKPEEVSVKITSRMCGVVYIDTRGARQENAVIAMTAMGIMDGKLIGDDMYFSPDDAVTRAEFIAMAMKTLGVRPNSQLKESFFDDNDDIPKSLMGYVATAQRKGIINGAFDGESLNFRPNEPITKYEASIIMAKLLGEENGDVSVSFENMQDIPVWARDEVGSMFRLGIFSAEECITRDATPTRIEVAEYLYRLSSVK